MPASLPFDGPSPVPPRSEPAGTVRRHEALGTALIGLALLALGVATYLGESPATGWPAFRVIIVTFAAVFGLGFLARAARSYVQRRRFARIADPDLPEEP